MAGLIALGTLAQEYRVALHEYCAQGGEAALLRAYQLGREALTGGLGVLEMVTLHQEALVSALMQRLVREESTHIARRASEFFAECLAPFELTRRGAADAHRMIREVNRGLERQLRAALRDCEAAQERLEEQRKAERLKDDFICFVSHEVRTPMTAVHGALSLLRKGLGGGLDEQGRQLLDVAYRNSRRLVRLVTDVLDLQRIESGTMTLNLRVLDVGTVLRQAVETSQAYALQNGVSLVLAAGGEGARVHADNDWLQQVLANLLSNAVKFSPVGEAVTVEAARRGEAVRFSITDRGPGVPPEFCDRLFTRFAQADPGSDKRGSGLGLRISKAVVELLGGEIGLDGGPGRTTFFFELPEWTPQTALPIESGGGPWPQDR